MKVVVCHRLPERSFSWNGHSFPVCARCTGVFVGQLSGLAAFAQPLAWWTCLLLLAPLLADWTAQECFGFSSTNRRRFVTGVLGGYGEVAFAVWMCLWLWYHR